MKSLQEITDAWGAWYSKKNGTTCRYTASTNYASQSSLKNYHKYQVTTECQSIIYDGKSVPTNGSNTAFETWFNNDTKIQNQQILKKTETSTQSFTWSITEALSIGVEISATEGVPAVASSTQKVTVDLSLSSTQSKTKTQSQSWEVDTIINIPASSSIKADIVIGTQSYDIKFTAAVNLHGNVAIWNNDKVNGHWLWFIPITSVLADCVAHNIIDTTGYTQVGGGISTKAKGVFSGSQGINVVVNTKQYPLGSDKLSAAKILTTQAIEQNNLVELVGQ